MIRMNKNSVTPGFQWKEDPRKELYEIERSGGERKEEEHGTHQLENEADRNDLTMPRSKVAEATAARERRRQAAVVPGAAPFPRHSVRFESWWQRQPLQRRTDSPP